MIAISLPPQKRSWSTLSFSSTLYLCPILDLLLAHVPPTLQAEIRLGLQEALVNAAIHGNQLDPSKAIVVEFSVSREGLCWVISDQGSGFIPHCHCASCSSTEIAPLPPDEAESGRGLSILHQIFDQVDWNTKGTQLRLSKRLPRMQMA
ncbi:anti-sigma regulatory factor [Synechocystis sp. LKSZ1]|uniref:ATP-binding protein n=1 Tax=Synechocystis sp. LKSZ1 TaxID=3144951 RepID=UPI00336BE463